MDKLDRAVAEGIISAAQRDRIRALPRAEGRGDGFRLSLVHVLWTAGAALIAVSLWLLAVQIASIDPDWLVWTCLVYAAALWLLDASVVRHRSMRVLSALLGMGGGICVALAVVAWQGTVGQPTYWQEWSRVPRWSAEAVLPYAPWIHGVYLPLVPVAVTAALMIRLRGFLPATALLAGAFLIVAVDLRIGLSGQMEGRDLRVLAAGLFAVGWACDLRLRDNHGFWVNKVAVLIFPIGLIADAFQGINLSILIWSLGAIGLSLFIRRPGGMAAGALGVMLYLGEWFDAWENLFVAAGIIAVIGLGSIAVGIKAHLIEDRLDAILPERVRRLRPAPRNDPVTFGF